MKKNKGALSLVIIIPMVVLTIAIVGIFGYKLYSEGTRTKAAEPVSMPKALPALQTTGKAKPQSRYGGLQVTPTPSPLSQNSGTTPVSAETLLTPFTPDTKTEFSSVDQLISGL